MKASVDKKIIRITELISAIIVALSSAFLILTGLGIFSFTTDDCWIVTVEICLFAISVLVATIQKNTISWGACGTLIPLLLAELLVMTGFAHRSIYPFYFLALPIGVVIACLSAKRFGLAFKVALIFLGVGLMLFLESSQFLPITVVLPIIAFLLGSVGIVYSLVRLRIKSGD